MKVQSNLTIGSVTNQTDKALLFSVINGDYTKENHKFWISRKFAYENVKGFVFYLPDHFEFEVIPCDDVLAKRGHEKIKVSAQELAKIILKEDLDRPLY